MVIVSPWILYNIIFEAEVYVGIITYYIIILGLEVIVIVKAVKDPNSEDIKLVSLHAYYSYLHANGQLLELL